MVIFCINQILFSYPYRSKHHQERQHFDRRYQCIRKSIAKNANLFHQEPSNYEITPPPTLPPDRQRELLVNVSKADLIEVMEGFVGFKSLKLKMKS